MQTTTYQIEWRNGEDEGWTVATAYRHDEAEARDAAHGILCRLRARYEQPQIRILRTVSTTEEIPLEIEPVPQIEETRQALAAAADKAKSAGIIGWKMATA